jgi:hypothetical protein
MASISSPFGSGAMIVFHSDYLYRAVVPRNELADAVAAQIKDIDYANFKSSVKDDVLHEGYLDVWQAMAALQSPPPYSMS